MHTACFYGFYFVLDVFVLAMHALMRVDHLHIQSNECTVHQNDDSESIYLEEFPHVED